MPGIVIEPAVTSTPTPGRRLSASLPGHFEDSGQISTRLRLTNGTATRFRLVSTAMSAGSPPVWIMGWPVPPLNRWRFESACAETSTRLPERTSTPSYLEPLLRPMSVRLLLPGTHDLMTDVPP